MGWLRAGGDYTAMGDVGNTAQRLQSAAEPGQVLIELNKLEAGEAACQPYLVVSNGSDRDFSGLKLDLVMFDTQGIIARRVAVDAAPLPRGKTVVKVFALDGLACAQIGRILLNGLTGCAADGGAARDDCLAMIATRSQTKVPFIQ